MTSLVLRPVQADGRYGRPPAGWPTETTAERSAERPVMPRYDDRDPCGGERILDFAICLILAAAVVGLLLLAL